MVRLSCILLTVGISLFTATSATAQWNIGFNTHLTGAQEVPPRATHAQGQALFRLSPDGQTLYYKLIVANIENVRAAHIHVAPAGVNGPVVVGLFSLGGPGRVQGLLADGAITSANLGGPLAAQPLSELLNAMIARNTYVNVHTNDLISPINTGPGDFPGGEIRGQIRPIGWVR